MRTGEKAIGTALQLAVQALSRLSNDLTPDLIHSLLVPFGHSVLIERRRAELILSRIRMVAVLFAILTPLWIGVDLTLFDWPLSGWLAMLRVLATAAFTLLALWAQGSTLHRAWTAMGWMLAVPTVFFMASHPVVNHFDPSSSAAALAAGYAFLPFIVIAGLAVFPITAVEGMILALPLLSAHVVAGLWGSAVFPFRSYIGAAWLLLLLIIVAVMSAMSQLHFLMALVNQSASDSLTGAYARQTGEEMLNFQFNLCRQAGRPLSVAFYDLDNFKAVNDGFGHEEGDKVLHEAGRSLRRSLRETDIVARWGGEEFLVIMPGTDRRGAMRAIERAREFGLGRRPDGTPQTASIGIADTVHDLPADCFALVELADHRMYLAKQAGKNRAICGDEVMA